MPIDIAELRRLEAEARASEGKYPPWSSLNTHEYALYVAMRNVLPELLKALEWQSMESAPRDGTFINAVARYPNATAGFPRYIAWYHPMNCWCEFSRHDPEPVVPWAWRPRDDWPSEPHGGGDV